MVYTSGSGTNGLAVIVDARTQFDHDCDEVLDGWSIGRNALGKIAWEQTLRIALRDYGTKPWSMAQVREVKPDVDAIIESAGITTMVMMQTPLIPGVKQKHAAWNMYGRGGSPYKWAGTVWHEDGLFRCPVLHPNNYEYVYGWLIKRWLRQAHAVAAGKLRPMPWPEFHLEVDGRMLHALSQLRASAEPVAVDIETNTGGAIITAIGLSNGQYTVSVPWDGYKIAGIDGWEQAIDEYYVGPLVKSAVLDVLACDVPKILHNGAFDVFQLRKRGIPVGGRLEDTLLLHRTIYPQYRHGLQQAAATEFCVEPWKAFHKPPKADKSKNADYDVWLATPEKTRHYNCQDSYVTYYLFKTLKWKVGLQ